MIALGTMLIRHRESIADVRAKVLGLLRSLQCTDVLAIRTATAVSETARQCLGSSVDVRIRIELFTDPEEALHLRLAFEDTDVPLDSGILNLFFDRVILSAQAPPRMVVAELRLQVMRAAIDDYVIRRERERIARKSRPELMEELRAKNQELQEHNKNLESTVAARTAELRTVNDRLQSDLDAGAAYVRELIPPPLQGGISIDWRYVPSSNLGGDTIGYHWLDDDHLAMYLIDVTGHGLDSALHAVTVTNVIRAGSLHSTDMKRPDEVVMRLNDAFQAENHGRKYFTIWYGVYQPSTRQLAWSGGGHHPSVLLLGEGPQAMLLESSGPMMGAVPGMDFDVARCAVPPSSRLLIFSDGIFEILRDNRLVWCLNGLNEYLATIPWSHASLMDDLLKHVHELRGSTSMDDDISIIEARFD